MRQWTYQGLYSLSGKTSYRKISWSLEAAWFGFKLFQSLWNLAGTSAALLPRCLSNFRAIRPLQHPISRLRDFTRFGGKTSYRLVNRGPELVQVTAWRLFRGKILAKTVLPYCRMNLYKTDLYKQFESMVLSWICIWTCLQIHDDVIKWKHFPRYWPFVRGIHRSPVNSPHKASDAELWCFLWFMPE